MTKNSRPALDVPAQLSHLTPGRKMTIALLGAIVASSFFCRMTLNPLQESMQADLGLTDNQVALVQGIAMALPALLGGIPVGLLVDRFNRVRLLTLFCLLNLTGTLLTALSNDLFMLLGARALVGFSTAAVAITIPSLFADLFPRQQRGRGSMIIGVSQIGGMGTAFVAGGALVTLFHSSSAWQFSALVMSAPLLVALVLAILLREQERMEIALEHPSLAKSGAELWSFRSVFVPLVCGVVAVSVADGATLVWAVPTLTRSFAVDPGSASAVVGTALVIGGLLGPVLGGFAADRCLNSGGALRAPALLALLAVFSAILGLFALAPGPATAGVCLTGFLLVGSMINSVSLTVLTVLLPNELRGFAVAVLSVSQILFSFGLAPSLVSVAAGATGGPSSVGFALAIVCVTTSLISAAAFFSGRAYLKRRPLRHEPAVAGPTFH